MVHGGDVYTEGILKGKELIDFSSNINPLGVPESFKLHVNEGVEALVRYPDIKYRRLKEALSEYAEINKDYLVLGNGAAELLDLAIGSVKSIALVVPSFAEYELSCKKWNVSIKYIPLQERNIKDKLYEKYIDYNDIIEALKYNEALMIANPNNPNGSIIEKNKFKDILEYAEENNKILIIDEAFIEFVGDIKLSLKDYVEKYKCLFIVRALTKFFAMPGIRLGYGFSSNEEFLNTIKKKQNPWNINSFAEIAGVYVLKDKEYIENSLKWIKNERDFMINSLLKIKVIKKVYKTHGNFVLVELEENLDCNKLYEKLFEKSILIRKANNYVNLNDKYVRFAIKDREKNKILIEALKDL